MTSEASRSDLVRELGNLLSGSGAFPYDEWSDDAGGSYSIDGLAGLIVEWLAGEGWLWFEPTDSEERG